MTHLANSFPWKKMSDGIILTSGISLIRNIAGLPFPGTATLEQQQAAARMIISALEQVSPGKWFGLACAEISKREQRLLEDCRILLPPLRDIQMLLTNQSGDFFMTLNAANHLEMKTYSAGKKDALVMQRRELDEIDRKLESKLSFAFHRRFGYLSDDPAMTGTGMTVSILLHLPAMAIRKKTKTIQESAQALGINVCGFSGSTSKYPGNLYWISNRSRMGETEDAILERMFRHAEHIAAEETKNRQELTDRDFGQLTDFCSRSRAVLQSAYRIQVQEAMNALSGLKLAHELGLFPCPGKIDWANVLLNIQPAHIGTDLSAVQEAELRAERLRKWALNL